VACNPFFNFASTQRWSPDYDLCRGTSRKSLIAVISLKILGSLFSFFFQGICGLAAPPKLTRRVSECLEKTGLLFILYVFSTFGVLSSVVDADEQGRGQHNLKVT